MEGGGRGAPSAVGAGIAGARDRREGVRTAPETRRGMGEVAGRARRSRRGGLGSQRRGRRPEGGAPPPPPGCGHYDYFGRQGASGRSTALCLSLALSLTRRPAPPFQPSGRATKSAPSLNCFQRLYSDLICEDADYVRRALAQLAHLIPLPRHGGARAVTRTRPLRTDAKADVLARATGTRAKKEQSVGPTDELGRRQRRAG